MPTLPEVPTASALADDLRAFITENFLFGRDPGGLTDDASLLERGILDSTGLLELIGFIERTYGLRLADDELVPKNLDSIQRLCSFVGRKLESREARQL
jgi:acyl carrier protein